MTGHAYVDADAGVKGRPVGLVRMGDAISAANSKEIPPTVNAVEKLPVASRT